MNGWRNRLANYHAADDRPNHTPTYEPQPTYLFRLPGAAVSGGEGILNLHLAVVVHYLQLMLSPCQGDDGVHQRLAQHVQRLRARSSLSEGDGEELHLAVKPIEGL